MMTKNYIKCAFFKKQHLCFLIALMNMYGSSLHGMNRKMYVPNLPCNIPFYLKGKEIIKGKTGKWYQRHSKNFLNPQPTDEELASLFISIKNDLVTILKNPSFELPFQRLQNYNNILLLSEADKLNIIRDQKIGDTLFAMANQYADESHLCIPEDLKTTINSVTGLPEINEKLLIALLQLCRSNAIIPTCLLLETIMPRSIGSPAVIECCKKPYLRHAASRAHLEYCSLISAEKRMDRTLFPEFREALHTAVNNDDIETIHLLLININEPKLLQNLLDGPITYNDLLTYRLLSAILTALTVGDSKSAVSFLEKIPHKEELITNQHNRFKTQTKRIIEESIWDNKTNVLAALFNRSLSDTTREQNRLFFSAVSTAITQKAKGLLVTLLSTKNSTGDSLTLREVVRILSAPPLHSGGYGRTTLCHIAANERNMYGILNTLMKPFQDDQAFKNKPLLCVHFLNMLHNDEDLRGQTPLDAASGDYDSFNLLTQLHNRASLELAFSIHGAKKTTFPKQAKKVKLKQRPLSQESHRS